MTGRERLVAALRGGEVDRKPVVALGPTSDADAVVVDSVSEIGDQAVLVRVDSPLTRALGSDLLEVLRQDPTSGHARLDALVSETRAEIAEALAGGADGVFYVIDGAYPSVTTPMQYGGYFLEHDRALLEEFREARANIAFLEGAGEVYLDSVSDLPADAIGWRSQETGFTPSMMRAMRSGPILADDPTADLQLSSPVHA